MGVAGSGKSVQGKLLADELGYYWLSTGEVLRKHISDERQDEMLAGKLLDDQEIIGVLGDFLTSFKKKQECVLDGFPRTLPQAEWLLDQHKRGKIKITAVVCLEALTTTVEKRLLARGRPDDHKEAIQLRFHEYEKQTLPIIESFKQAKIPVYAVDGENQIEEVHQDVLSVLGQKIVKL